MAHVAAWAIDLILRHSPRRFPLKLSPELSAGLPRWLCAENATLLGQFP